MSLDTLDWSDLSVQMLITFGHFLWQACIVVIVFTMIDRLLSMSHRLASFRYCIACIAFFSLPVCVVATFSWVHRSYGSILVNASLLATSLTNPTHVALETNQPDEPSVAPKPSPNTLAAESSSLVAEPNELLSAGAFADSWQMHVHQFAPYALIVYFLGVAAMLARFGISLAASSRLRRTIQPIVDLDLLRIVAEQSSLLGLKRVPMLAFCQKVNVPVVVGILKPMILLPPSLLCGLDPHQLTAILTHELAHIRRYDSIVNLFQRFIEALLFFHPVTWWISRRVSIERENCCDDIAATTTGRLPYAAALLQMAEICIGNDRRRTIGLAALSADGGNRTNLGYRIRRLIGAEESSRVCLTRRSLVSAMLMVSVIACAFIVRGQGQEPKKELPEEVKVKYPYCLVKNEDLHERPLIDAINVFNRDALESPLGVRQPPITETETRDAISKSLKDSSLPEAVRNQLNQVLMTGSLPANAYFRRFTRFDDERQMHEVWWVRLVIESESGPIHSVPVRTTNLKIRPYTQMERQQNAGAITLINRFVSYFAEPANILLLVEFPHDAVQRLVNDAESSIKSQDVEAFLSFFEWSGVSEQTKDFVKSEFKELSASKIHSIKVKPRNFRGELVHWSAYQHYQPNMEIVGYLDIDFTDSDDIRKTLSLEMGKVDNQLRLVNYVPKGDRKLPEGPVNKISIRAHLERVADGGVFETWTITNPETLLSGHVANEEIRLRHLAKEKVAKQGSLSGSDSRKLAAMVFGKKVFVEELGWESSKAAYNKLPPDQIAVKRMEVEGEALLSFISRQAVADYVRREKIEVTPELSSQLSEVVNTTELPPNPDPSVSEERQRLGLRVMMHASLMDWLVCKSLYERYGGRVGMGSLGLWIAVDGRNELIREYLKNGNIQIVDANIEKAFWRAATKPNFADAYPKGDELKRLMAAPPFLSNR